MCGSNNKTTLREYGSPPNGGLIAGYNNTVDAFSGTSICLGANNVVYGNNQIFIGFDNTAHNSTSFKSVCLGRGLDVDNIDLKQKVVVGTYNAQTASLPSEKGKLQTIIGGGDSEYLGHRHNAIEVYSQYQGCLVVFPKQIALSNYTTSNKASVNAIVPPSDPNNVTADDQTLATKAYVDGYTRGISVKRSEVLVSGQSELITPGAYLPLETAFNITIPSWATALILGLNRVVSGGDYFTYLTIDLSTSRRYSGSLEDTSDIIHYDVSQQAVGTLINDLSVVSVTAEGTVSI